MNSSFNIFSYRSNSYRVAYFKAFADKNQARFEFKPIPQEFQDNPVDYMEKLVPCKQTMIKYYIWMSVHFPVIYTSQTRIGEIAGIGREHCNRMIRELIAAGFLSKFNRGVKKTCLYKVNPLLMQPQYRTNLGRIFHTLKVLSFILLTQVQLKLLGNINKNILPTSKTELSQEGRVMYENSLSSKTLEMIMKNDSPANPIAPAIRNMKELALSRWGQIKLSAFPSEAIEYASSRIQHFKDLKNPFNCFFVLCLEYCTGNNIEPDWAWSRQLEVSYKMPENPSMLLRTFEAAPPSPFAKQPTLVGYKDTPFSTHQEESGQNKQESQKGGLVTKSANPMHQPGIMGINPKLMHKTQEPAKLTIDEKVEEITRIQDSFTHHVPDWMMGYGMNVCKSIEIRR